MIFKTAFLITPPDWQWVVSIILPIAREINMAGQMKLSYKAGGSRGDSIELFREHYMGTQHCLFLSSSMGGDITNLSTYILIGTDTVLNFYLAAKLIWMKRKNKIEENIEEARQLLTSLLNNEIIELVTAVAFLVCLLLSYDGPNATLMGNIKGNHFHYKPITNIDIFTNNLLFFVYIDLFCIVMTSSCLWIFARIDVLRGNAFLQQEFWFMMTVNAAYWINNHFSASHIKDALDFTFEFEWLQEANHTSFLAMNDTT